VNIGISKWFGAADRKRDAEIIRSLRDQLAISEKVNRDLVAEREVLKNTIEMLREQAAQERTAHELIQQAARESAIRRNRSMASLLLWIKETHRIDHVPDNGSIRDLLLKS
jgi:hypothetical protein